MALFSRKKPEMNKPGEDAAADGAAPATDFQPQPEKARKWFEHARTYAETYNYDGALFSYANGIKFDPEAMSAHEGMYEAAIKYMNKGGKAASGKEIRTLDDAHPVSRFAAAEFAWMKDIANGALAMKTLEAAIKSNQLEFGNWVAPRILAALRRAKKVSKSQLVQAKDLFKQVGAWNEALTAGQLALQLDPSDNQLDHEIKDISAQRAMDQGGYEKAAGKEGGFRGFVKDAERQRQLVESESIAGSATTEERNLLRAKMAYEKAPTSPDAINQYAQLVKKQATPEAEQLAHEIYMKGFADTGEYRFRMAAGDIKLDQARRALEAAQAKADLQPADETLKQHADAARRQVLELEASEYKERIARYPTDRFLKVKLGEIEFGLGNYDAAMEALQASKDEPKLRVRAAHMLGRCFAAEGWHMDAIGEFKEALSQIDLTEKERELGIRYDLMVSLLAYARLERSVEHAKEALEICSGIVRRDITYRDIRAKRREIEQVVRDLSGNAEAAPT